VMKGLQAGSEPDIKNKREVSDGFDLDSDHCDSGVDISAGLPAAEVRCLHLTEARLPGGR
jgi:hypothetical protein